jgi:hypothetical protein
MEPRSKLMMMLIIIGHETEKKTIWGLRGIGMSGEEKRKRH